MSGKIQSTNCQRETDPVNGKGNRFFERLELRAGHALAECRLSGKGSISSNVIAFETG